MKANWVVLAGIGVGTLGAQSHITVQLNNIVRSPEPILSAAKATAASVFDQAGIKIEWVDCLVANGQQVQQPPCIESSNPGQFTLAIRQSAGAVPLDDTALGYALPFSGARNHGAVLYQPILRIAQQNFPEVDCGTLLGASIAHELGHLLMGSTRHAPGIMKANWLRADLIAIAHGRLLFAPEQIRQFRVGLQSRNGVAGTDLLLLARR